MTGFDWPRLHAALNDLPAALLLISVVFDLVGTVTKRDSLHAAGFWTLIAGVLGGGAAAVAGLLAEDAVQHSDRAHEVMETHQTLAIIVLILFGVLALWRLVRRGVWSPREQPVALTAGVIGVALMIYAAKLGGTLVFDHGLGISTTRIEAIPAERGATEGAVHEHGAPADSAAAAHDSVPHEHPADSAPQ